MALTYKSAGVDTAAKNLLLTRIKKYARTTFTSGVVSDLGLFGGLFSIDATTYQKPILVSSVDGVGTKLKLAFMMDKHDTVGLDIVSHCVNDILVQGARPLFFMDYIATGKLDLKTLESVIKGIAVGCKRAGCALIGGETAEMPGFYPPGEYDLVGFIVGVVERNKIIDGKHIQPGDKVIGLDSSGLHTNGFSLARKLIFELAKYKPNDYIESLGTTIGEALLTPHKCYATSILSIIYPEKLNTKKKSNSRLNRNDAIDTKSRTSSIIKGMAHITGGGFYDNIPRILPKNVNVIIDKSAWEVPEIFRILQKLGNISDREMFWTFNMGIGLILIVSETNVDFIISELTKSGETPHLIGEVKQGNRKVIIS
ncbi:MAG: phosphoribosylformylglycinamidine cyclo-ligase [bacterium]|nr:phosphoribosylformylglycinamidine cyclo-ligase [bacterium]